MTVSPDSDSVTDPDEDTSAGWTFQKTLNQLRALGIAVLISPEEES